eukprot:TRINITY_DN101711_c0_g1_i1.p1 TRINITY_DN101711_c0_g1~~TRINITY_DN101711_c0_g1_i1.p1  ORF type:complete len:390 (-),score=30.77 TRINITY_DN101711_c0_g1_i1:45-1112(-)
MSLFACAWALDSATSQQRAEAAVLGAIVADAAAMPLHWIYDPDAIASLLQQFHREGRPEFFPKPSGCCYNGTVGTQTPYGNQTIVLLDALASSAEASETEMLSRYALQYYEEFRDVSTHAWTDASTRGFISNYAAGKRWPACGAADSQANALAHMVPIVAATWCLEEQKALDITEHVIRTTQNTDEAAAFGTAGARILRRVIAGKSLADAVNDTVTILRTSKERLPCCDGFFADRLSEAFRVRDRVSHMDAVLLAGSSCMYPQNLVSGAHLLASMTKPDFEAGIRATIMASGDQASRGMFIGAALAAALGSPEEVPWTGQARNAEKVKRLAKAVVSSCHAGIWPGVQEPSLPLHV